MLNAMAVLNLFGIEYDINQIFFPLERKLDELISEGALVDFIGFEVGDQFNSKVEEYVKMPSYGKVSGKYWAKDNGRCIIIQLVRYQELDNYELMKYASKFGCEVMEMMNNYGEPDIDYNLFNIRVKKVIFMDY